MREDTSRWVNFLPYRWLVSPYSYMVGNLSNFYLLVCFRMFFSLVELAVWLGLSILEIWLNIVSILLFTILLAFKNSETSWWTVLMPLFVADAFNCYLCVILLIRTALSGHLRSGLFRASWSFTLLTLLFVFKILLAKKLSAAIVLEYSEVMSPIFILLQLIAARGCQTHWLWRRIPHNAIQVSYV